jgi:MFS family permease
VLTRPAPDALWRNRDFGIFWLAQTLSTAGDSFSYVAIPLLILHATGSVTQMGLLTGLTGAASILTGIFAGVVVDRVDRRRLLIACDVGRAMLYALVPLAWLLGPQTWLLYLVMPLGGAFGMLFQVGYVTAVPNLVEPDRITEANGRLYASYAAASIRGTKHAGVVSGLFGPTAAIAIDAASFAVSGLGLFLVRLVSHVTSSGVTWSSLLVGARFLWRHPVLRALTVLLSFLTFLTLGLTDIFIYHLKHDLAQPDSTVGYVLACAALGTVVAALIVAPARRRLGFGACWIGSYALVGFVIAGVGRSTSVPVVAALITAFAFGTSTAGICSMSLRQEVTPDYLLGRVTSAFWTIHSALGPAGAAILTAAASRYGVGPVTALSGLACLAVAASAALTPIRLP